jgi:hypothetical protein
MAKVTVKVYVRRLSLIARLWYSILRPEDE